MLLQSPSADYSAGESTSKASSKGSKASKVSARSEKTQKVGNQSPSPRSILNLGGGGGGMNSHNNSHMYTTSQSPRNLFGRKVDSKEDKKIAAYVIKVKAEIQHQGEEVHRDTKRLVELLTKIRMLLDVRVERGDKSALPATIELGPTVVEVMRQHPTHVQLTEESSCILYFLSVLDPSFKKGVARLFKAMGEHKSNVAVQRASAEAIRNVVQANPESLSRIAPSLGVILQSMAVHGSNPKLIFKSLELLADLALEPTAKTLFVQKGGVGLLHVLSAMNRHSVDPSLQAAGCRCVANLSLGANVAVLQRLTPSLDVILRAMNRHPSHKHVQLYGCWALGNLAHWHHAEIVHQGGVDAILPTMRENLPDGRIQEQACVALSKLVEAAKDSETQHTYVEAITSQDGIPTVLQTLTQHAGTAAIQLEGLGVLFACVSNSMDNHEILLSEGGLDVVLRALTTHDRNVQVAGKGMELLKSFTRQSLDFQRVVYAKGGIGSVLQILRLHRESHAVQDAGFATMRNIAIHPENRDTVVQQGGIPTLIGNMEIYIGDAAIQAYGCDALGRLAQSANTSTTTADDSISSECRDLILANSGLEAALTAMSAHANHPGVQDRAIFLLGNMVAGHPDALEALKEPHHAALETIKSARIPQKAAALERCAQLVQTLESSSARGWFGRK